jgi:hypothetical protein
VKIVEKAEDEHCYNERVSASVLSPPVVNASGTVVLVAIQAQSKHIPQAWRGLLHLHVSRFTKKSERFANSKVSTQIFNRFS